MSCRLEPLEFPDPQHWLSIACPRQPAAVLGFRRLQGVQVQSLPQELTASSLLKTFRVGLL